MIGTIHYTTDRTRANQAHPDLERRLLHTQKLGSLGVLASAIAHDLNNLLMAILGNLDLALMDLSPDSSSRASIEQTALAARRAADLTREILAYSGKGSFVIHSLGLSELVGENARLFRACISKLVTLDLETASNLPHINADLEVLRPRSFPRLRRGSGWSMPSAPSASNSSRRLRRRWMRYATASVARILPKPTLRPPAHAARS